MSESKRRRIARTYTGDITVVWNWLTSSKYFEHDTSGKERGKMSMCCGTKGRRPTQLVLFSISSPIQ
jgi:hypothetical protein